MKQSVCGSGRAAATSLARVLKGVRRIGVRLGNWLTVEQGKRLLRNVEKESLRGVRNYAILAMLIGCGLRRGELLSLRVDSIQSREERWVIADLLGKAGHVRTVPIPAWVRTGIEKWMREFSWRSSASPS